MAYKYSDNCGLSASDNYDDWNRIGNTSNDWRYHKITGYGVVTTCSANDSYPIWIYRYHSMDSGITELANVSSADLLNETFTTGIPFTI
jgi:hypothetical protein